MSDFVYPWCEECGDNFPMRDGKHAELEDCGNTFYCPQGHALTIARTTITAAMRRAKRQIGYYRDDRDRLTKKLSALHGLQTRHKNRLLSGVCPYCNQKPRDVIKHIQAYHKHKVM